MDIIPGLPNDIAFDCLIRVPFSELQSLRSVCKAWKSKLPEFLSFRKSTGKAQPLFVFALKRGYFLVFELETGFWSKMPPIPNGLPQYRGIVAVGSTLVVIGGHNLNLQSSFDSVFTFNFLTSTWSSGGNIPDGCRMLFACATDGNRTVFVAGGYQKGNAVKSAWTYDVPTNSWNQLPDMDRKHVWCTGLFHRGKFHVSDQYTPNDNDYHKSLEIFDMSSREWSEKWTIFQDAIRTSTTCAVGSDQKIYTCHGRNILVLEDDEYKVVAKLPTDMEDPQSMIFSLGYLWLKGKSKMVNNCRRLLYSFYKIDMKDHIWTKLTTPVKFD